LPKKGNSQEDRTAAYFDPSVGVHEFARVYVARSEAANAALHEFSVVIRREKAREVFGDYKFGHTPKNDGSHPSGGPPTIK
jgi:hypothetical protein